MDRSQDDLYVAMDNETEYEGDSFSKKAGRFCKKSLLAIVAIGLLFILIIQFIIIAGDGDTSVVWPIGDDTVADAVDELNNIIADQTDALADAAAAGEADAAGEAAAETAATDSTASTDSTTTADEAVAEASEAISSSVELAPEAVQEGIADSLETVADVFDQAATDVVSQ